MKVAIIDDGFDLDNPLWAANIAHNVKDIPGNDVDDDHNGKVDDYEGWDFGDNDAEVRPARNMLDKESHGTHVLGVFWEVLQQLSADAPSGIRILPIKAVSDGHLNNYLKEGYKGDRVCDRTESRRHYLQLVGAADRTGRKSVAGKGA